MVGFEKETHLKKEVTKVAGVAVANEAEKSSVWADGVESDGDRSADWWRWCTKFNLCRDSISENAEASALKFLISSFILESTIGKCFFPEGKTQLVEALQFY